MKVSGTRTDFSGPFECPATETSDSPRTVRLARAGDEFLELGFTKARRAAGRQSLVRQDGQQWPLDDSRWRPESSHLRHARSGGLPGSRIFLAAEHSG